MPGGSSIRGRAALRLLFVGNFFKANGAASQYCHDLAAHFEAAGHRVLRTSVYHFRPLRLADMLLTVARRRRDYDIAHVDVFSGPSFVWAATVGRLLAGLGKPFVLTLHGGNLPNFAQHHPGAVKRLLRQAAVVTAPSGYLAQALAKFREDFAVVPNALDVTPYPFRHRDPATPSLVWLRAYHAIYAPDLAVRTMALLRESVPEAHLCMVGPEKDGSLDQCRRLAAELGVSDAITFSLGIEKDKVPATLQRHDIFINTTTVDNTPVSVIEAMACGLCVVSTNVGGIPFLLEHERDALLVPPDDAQAMAAAVLRILNEPGLSERLSRNARAKAEGFDWAAVLPRWRRLFQTVGERAEARRGADCRGAARS
ncbi:MAG: glycosyltransferase family 4 protein [Candidatus Bipolaricaulota bacterium]